MPSLRLPKRDPEPRRRLAGLDVRVVVALAAGMVVVAVPLARVLLHHDRRLAATNTHVIASRNGVVIAAHSERCQAGEYVPRAASILRVYPGAAGLRAGEPLVVRLRAQDGTTVATSRVPGGYPLARLQIPLPPRPAALQVATLCIRNDGPAPMSFAGNLTSSEPEAPFTVNTPYQREHTDEVRADYLLPGYRTYVSIAPTVAQRFSLFKPSFVKPYWMWLALGAMAALVALGSVTLLRELRTP
jgi:hypothetical protein